ncbi:hypothetical protein FB45DRAFT_913879 [Roridomyces roridus]|uniref:Secreted protein n=1 Tax=Roridomyces roridus TaxID=1738132 RepID=A0AAD7FQ77_9AGAR|nr:hypothetical protein FB45DRAFT_913879 [Roridomyces roridus]
MFAAILLLVFLPPLLAYPSPTSMCTPVLKANGLPFCNPFLCLRPPKSPRTRWARRRYYLGGLGPSRLWLQQGALQDGRRP